MPTGFQAFFFREYNYMHIEFTTVDAFGPVISSWPIQNHNSNCTESWAVKQT